MELSAEKRGDMTTAQCLRAAQDSSRPAERWFLAIRLDCTPTNSPVAAITLEWIDQWIANHNRTTAIDTTHTPA